MPHAVPCPSRFLLHGNDASGENYQKILTEKNMICYLMNIAFKEDKDLVCAKIELISFVA